MPKDGQCLPLWQTCPPVLPPMFIARLSLSLCLCERASVLQHLWQLFEKETVASSTRVS